MVGRCWLGAHLLGEWDRSHWACGTSTEPRGKDSQHRFSCAILQRLSCWLGVVKNRQGGPNQETIPRFFVPPGVFQREPTSVQIPYDSIAATSVGQHTWNHPDNTPSIESSWDVVGEAARFSNSLLTFPCPAQGAGHGCKVMLITTVFWLSSYMMLYAWCYFWCAYQKCSHAIGFVPLQSLQETYTLAIGLYQKKTWFQMSMFPEIIPITLGWCRPHPPQRAGRWFSPHRGVGPEESGSSALHRSRHCPGDLGQPIHNLGRSRNSVWWLSHQPPIPKKMIGSFQSSIPFLVFSAKKE